MWNIVSSQKWACRAVMVARGSWLGPARGWSENRCLSAHPDSFRRHLPFVPRETPDPAKEQRIMAAKQNLIADINAWDDVSQIVATGDCSDLMGLTKSTLRKSLLC